jgi:ATP-dependent helicase/nuclease subunit A
VESEFWQRIMRAERRYLEIPFSIKTSQQELAGLGGQQTPARRKSDAGKGDDLPVILNGTIDLVFWEESEGGRSRKDTKGRGPERDAGWVIADYKTDYIRPQLIDDDLADLVKIYAPQVRLYARFWSRTTGEPVKEAGLYFTSIDRWVKIQLS